MAVIFAIFFVPVAFAVMGPAVALGILLFCLLAAVAGASASACPPVEGEEVEGEVVYNEDCNEIGWIG